MRLTRDPRREMNDDFLWRLEHDIRKVYIQAQTEVRQTANKYLEELDRRRDLLIDAIVEGNVTIPSGETEETYFAKWWANQVGRGERWKSVRDTIVTDLVDADVKARSIINDAVLTVCAENRNFTAYEIESKFAGVPLGGKRASIAFNLVNEGAIKHLVSGGTIDRRVDYSWNTRKIQTELTAGILHGDSIEHLAKRFERVGQMDHNAAIRNARTACTEAENAGTLDAMEEAQEMGIEVQKEWIATSDSRTRDSHHELDGVRVDIDEPFPNGLMYPGDMTGEPEEVYNCRCTMRTVIVGYDNEDTHVTGHTQESYSEWKRRKEEVQDVG